MMANLNFQQPPRSIANSFSNNNNNINSSSSSSARNQFLQNQQQPSGSTAPINISSSSIIGNNNSNSNSVGVISSLMASSANNSLAQQQQSASSLATPTSQNNSNNNNNSSSSLSGHVTPTSAMFNNGGGSGGGSGMGGIGSDRGGPQQQQQMPIGGPNNAQQQGNSGGQGGGGGSSLLGYRSYSNFSQVNARAGSMPNNSNMNKSILSRTTGPFGLVGGGGSGGLQSYPSVFGGMGGMVKQQQTSEQSEFQMSNEDFPALPGTQHQTQHSTQQQQQQQQQQHLGNDQGSVSGLLMGGGNSLGNIGEGSGGSTNNGGGGGGLLLGGSGSGATNGGGASGMGMMGGMDGLQGEGGGGGGMLDKQQQLLLKRATAVGGGSGGGVQTSPDGKVTNIPASMVNNQYGMVGLLTLLRESDPNLVTLAMGQDLTTLGLNLNSSEKLFPSFGGPFAHQPCRPQDIDFHVPPEYLVNMSIREKLSPFQLKKYKDDLLFFLFYTNVGDRMQVLVAEELQSRDWRYHIEEKVWITRMPHAIFEKNGTTERGVFFYFDAQNWRRVPRDSFIDTGKLVPTSRV